MFGFEFLKHKTKMLVWLLCVLESLLYLLLSIMMEYDTTEALLALVVKGTQSAAAHAH